MLRLYAGNGLRPFNASLSTEGRFRRGKACGFWLARSESILAQPICLSLGAARSLPATKTRPWWWGKMSVDGLSLL